MVLEMRRPGPHPGHAWVLCGVERNHLTSFHLTLWVIQKNDRTGKHNLEDTVIQIPNLSFTICVNLGKSLNFSDPCEK